MHKKHLGIMSACRLRLGRSVVGSSDKLPGVAHVNGAWTPLRVAPWSVDNLFDSLGCELGVELA